MFLINLSYRVAPDVVDAHLDAHRAFLGRGYAAGHFICSGPKAPRTGGIILARGDYDTVMRLISEDPFYVHSVAEYHLQEFQPTMWAPGFEGFV
ncbi:MAG: GTP cyclohydrolase [Chitinophagaceae bacterium]|nr:MAG: GTP cyclohydrolase [Chitinophagaceae bacterium]